MGAAGPSIEPTTTPTGRPDDRDAHRGSTSPAAAPRRKIKNCYRASAAPTNKRLLPRRDGNKK